MEKINQITDAKGFEEKTIIKITDFILNQLNEINGYVYLYSLLIVD